MELCFAATRKMLVSGISLDLLFGQRYKSETQQVGAVKSLATNEGAELVRRCRTGDGAAWEEIVQTYTRRVYNLAYRFTSRADAAEVSSTIRNKVICRTG